MCIYTFSAETWGSGMCVTAWSTLSRCQMGYKRHKGVICTPITSMITAHHGLCIFVTIYFLFSCHHQTASARTENTLDCKSLCAPLTHARTVISALPTAEEVLHAVHRSYNALPAVELMHTFCIISAFSYNSTVWFMHIYFAANLTADADIDCGILSLLETCLTVQKYSSQKQNV